MRTDELIQNLSGELAPVAPGAPARRIALGMGGGALVSTALMLGWLGLRPDLAQAISTAMFWMKFSYAALTGLILAVLLTRLARPAVRAGALAALAMAPLAVVIVMALAGLATAPSGMQEHLLMGHSSALCPWRILVIGLPLLGGAVWATRGLAPTHLPLAGLVAGGSAGGLGAAIYAFACTETSAPFLAIWYTLGMALVAALGALSGPRLLRWK